MTGLVLAHRGLTRKAPENTLAAIQGAHEAGCDGAEFDVRRLADGTLVLHHDDVVRVSTGPRPLRTLGWDDFARFSPAATRLADVVDWAKPHPAFWLDVEIKDSEAVRPVLDALGRRKENLAVTSFDLSTATFAKRSAPDRMAGWISDERRNDLPRLAADAGLDLLVVHRSNATGALMGDARSRRLRVWVWGVNWAYQRRALEARGATGFITDAPQRLVSRPRASTNPGR